MTNNLYAKIHFFRGALPKANGIRAVIVSVIRQSIHRKQEAEKNTKSDAVHPNGIAPVSTPPTARPQLRWPVA